MTYNATDYYKEIEVNVVPVEKGIFDFDYIISLFNMYKDWLD